MAKKAAAKKGAPSVESAIPEGFTAVSGVNTPAWDFENNDTIQGEVLSIKAVRKGGKILSDTRVMTVKENSSGNVFAVWEAALLGDLFDVAKPGKEIFIRYDGVDTSKAPKKGQSPTKLFTTGIK